MSKEEQPITGHLNVENPDLDLKEPQNEDDKNVKELWSPIRSPVGACSSGTAKVEENVAGPSGAKSGDLSATSPGPKNEVKEDPDTNIGSGTTKDVAGPSGTNTNAPETDEQDEYVDIDSVDDNNGLTDAQVLQAQIDEEERRSNEQAAERQRQRQAPKSGSSSPKRQRLD